MTNQPKLTVFRTPPQRERDAADEARAVGLRAYVPMQTRERRVSAHTKTKTVSYVPVAAGYVIASGKPGMRTVTEAYRVGDNDVRIRELLVEGSTYIRDAVGQVDRQEVTAFYRSTRETTTRSRAAAKSSKQPKRFSPGQTVRVVDGNGQGRVGTVISIRNKTMCMVEIDGRQYAVKNFRLEAA